MKKKNIGKIFFYIVAAFILITLLLSFSMTGCGRRALLREKIRARMASEESQSESSQSDNADNSSFSQETDSATEETVEEESGLNEDVITGEAPASQETASNDIDPEESESVQDDEIADGESAEEESNEDGSQDEQSPVEVTVPIAEGECGCILGGEAYGRDSFWVGDDGDNNLESRGYMSYDISGLAGSTIEEASITALANIDYGSPFETYGPIIIKAIFWGKNPITPSVYDLDGVELANFSQRDFTISNDILKNDLQNAVNSASERYQITLYFEMNGTDGDSVSDSIIYHINNLQLNVTYIPGE